MLDTLDVVIDAEIIEAKKMTYFYKSTVDKAVDFLYYKRTEKLNKRM